MLTHGLYSAMIKNCYFSVLTHSCWNVIFGIFCSNSWKPFNHQPKLLIILLHTFSWFLPWCVCRLSLYTRLPCLLDQRNPYTVNLKFFCSWSLSALPTYMQNLSGVTAFNTMFSNSTRLCLWVLALPSSLTLNSVSLNSGTLICVDAHLGCSITATKQCINNSF